MLYTVTSKKEIDRVGSELQAAVVKRGFGVMSVHNLKETMAKKGVVFGPECRIYEVCNPQQAKRVLEQRLEVSVALPCRISVYSDGDEVKLATMKPTLMLEMFGESGLKEVAEEVERVIVESMDEAAK